LRRSTGSTTPSATHPADRFGLGVFALGEHHSPDFFAVS
jgi:hypothetical protein